MLFMWCFDPLPCQRGPLDILKVAGEALCRGLSHGKASWSLLSFVCQFLTKRSYSRPLVLPWDSRWEPLSSWSCLIWKGPWRRMRRYRTFLRPERTEWPRVGVYSPALSKQPRHASGERWGWRKAFRSIFPLVEKRTRVRPLKSGLGICMQATPPKYFPGCTCNVRCSCDAGPSF
ncbi:hypothetical protein BHE74_00021215 [Ensete ventricosum]|nr:hypothetical protein BHE74_00021215 [Ensete ventricosum]